MSIHKYSVMISGHHTSISLEPEFWEELKKTAASQNLTTVELITQIDRQRTGNLSSAIRVYILNQLLLKEKSFTNAP